MAYGPRNPELRGDALWLEEFMRAHGLTVETTSHVLGVNQARIWEWLAQRRVMPTDARARLESWAADGCPRFKYWDPYRYRHLGASAAAPAGGDAAVALSVRESWRES